MTSPSRHLLFFLFLFTACREPATLRDDVGRAVVLPPRIERVITLAPNVTEIVAAAGAQSKIVATDDASNAPAGIEALPKVGGGLEPNLERVAELRPDLVLASSTGNVPSLAAALENLGVPLYLVKTDRLSDVPRAVARVGAILGVADAARRARDLVAQLERERRTRPRKPRVLFLVWTDPLYVAGAETYMDDLLRDAGAENAAAGVTGWPQYSMEALLAKPPDVILFPRAAVGGDRIERLFSTDERWRALAAVRERRYVAVDDDRFSRPGPRLVEALAELNRILDTVSF